MWYSFLLTLKHYIRLGDENCLTLRACPRITPNLVLVGTDSFVIQMLVLVGTNSFVG